MAHIPPVLPLFSCHQGNDLSPYSANLHSVNLYSVNLHSSSPKFNLKLSGALLPHIGQWAGAIALLGAILTTPTPGLAQSSEPLHGTQENASAPISTSDSSDLSQNATPPRDGENSEPFNPQAIEASPVPRRNAAVDAPYTLGTGDQIEIDIFGVPEFSGANNRRTILVDGSISLPWVGRIALAGLSLEDAASLLERAYAPYINDPIISLNLVGIRNLRVNVVGEVNRPGSYVVSPEGVDTVGDIGVGQVGGNVSQWPTVTQAIQTAGGITQFANLKDVQIRRVNAYGYEETITVNIWNLLKTGQIQEDIPLRDRDTIIIPTATALSPDELTLLGSANVSPALIQISISGEVANPGILEVPPNTSLNQALSMAGGFTPRSRRDQIDLVRLNPDGTAVAQTVSLDNTAGLNAVSNPALRDNDVVIVQRTNAVAIGDTVDPILRPIAQGLGILSIFGLFDN